MLMIVLFIIDYKIMKQFLLVLLIVIGPSLSNAKLFITAPAELVEAVKVKYSEEIPYSIANYGDVPFGSTLSGNIYIPEVLSNCKKQSLTDPNASLEINKIVMSKRGECTFTTKSLNSQSEGAKMAIISDNKSTQNPARIILVDDGRGPQVKIPTIFITEQLGEMIESYVIKGKKVNIAFRFDTHEEQKADVTIWMNSFDRKSYMLIRQLQPYFSRINDFINMRIYHTTSHCDYCPKTDCYCESEFCILTNYEGYVHSGLGQNVMWEQIREQKILEKYPDLWWKYMLTYDDQCEDKGDINNCSIRVMTELGIDAQGIELSVKQTFVNKTRIDPETNQTVSYQDNTVLRANSDLQSKSGVILYPAILVNNITYRGNIQGLDIFQLVCNSLVEQPEGCSFEVRQPETPWKIIIPIVVCFLVFMIFLICCYRRKVRRQLSKDINKEVNALVNQYITMYEAQKFQNKQQSE